MTPDMNDKFTHVALGTKTELASPGHSIGGNTINANDLSIWPDNTAAFFGMDKLDPVTGKRVEGTYTVWKALRAGNTLGSMLLVDGDADQDYDAGVSTRVYMPITAAWANSVIDGLLVSHNKDGSLKTGAVSTATMLADSVVTTAKIADDAITSAKLAPTKSTDANGWTVFDYGTWKRYIKRFSVSGLGTKVAGESATIVAGAALPSDLTTLSTNPIRVSNAVLADHGYALGVGIEATTASGTFNISGINNDVSSRSFTGWVEVEITA